MQKTKNQQTQIENDLEYRDEQHQSNSTKASKFKKLQTC